MNGVRRRLRAAIAVGATAVAAAGVAVVAAAPAYADEPGLFCTVTARGTMSAPSPVQYGQFITVQWSSQHDYCSSPVFYIDGPGFGGGYENVGDAGSRQVRAVTDGSTMTWSLHVFDMDTDSRTPAQIASVTIAVL